MVVLLPLYLGASAWSDSHTDPTTPVSFNLPIPGGGTKADDLLVASIITMSSLVPPGRGLTALHTSSDWVDLTGATWNIGVYAGPWDGDTTPIAWQGSGYNSGVGQFYAAFLASFRNRLDPTRPTAVSNGPTVPGLSGEGPSICVDWVRAALGGDSGFAPFQGTDWTTTAAVDGTYVLGTVASNGGVVASQTATDSTDLGGAANVGRYVSFGVVPFRDAPPCRIYPREDNQGVGSGRLWPPARSHQASPRRAGGYY